ncbi:MAG: substrate-binding domain-containing protein [Actinomycetota bacterium]|jgi:ribose transport system substrate-binding protein|nr:substrate-binding domain-containing protein [Actinomycetota bacterium]MDA8359720.1 substrate-binding domain-containing protein [Actinomycetota bacterium]
MRRLAVTATVTVGMAGLAIGVAGASASATPPIGAAGTRPVTKTVGPLGTAATPAASVTITKAEIAKLKKGHYTAAMAWHEESTFSQGVTAGADAEFKALGIKVVATTQANFNAATQVNQLQTIEALKPSVILSLPVNPATEASAYKQVSAKGSKLVLLSNLPKGLKFPSQYQGIVTDDLNQMGRKAAQLLGSAMHGHGNVGFIYYAATYYVTNERDAAFRTWIRKLYPKIKIVAQEAMPTQTKGATVTTAMMTRYPNITGIYAPWSDAPAEGVIAALRTLGKTNVKVVTITLDPSIDGNLCTGQYLAGIVATQPYLLGETMAKEAGLAILKKQTPKFSVVGALAVRKSNILKAWKISLAQAPPSNVVKACK